MQVALDKRVCNIMKFNIVVSELGTTPTMNLMFNCKGYMLEECAIHRLVYPQMYVRINPTKY